MSSDASTRTVSLESGGAASVWLPQIRAFSERSLREVGNSWPMLLTALAFPAGLQLFYGLVWEDVSATVIASTAVGTGVFGAMYVCLYIFGYQLAGDLEDDRYEAYRSMPVSPLADLLGRMLSGLVLATISFVLTILVAAATGGAFALRGLESIPIVVLAFVLTCAFWMILALPFIVYAENERVAEYAVPMIALFGYMLTGFNGANVDLAMTDGEILNYLPNALSTRLLVYHLVPASDWTGIGAAPPAMPVGHEFVALLAVYAAAALLVGTVLVNRVLYRRGWWP